MIIDAHIHLFPTKEVGTQLLEDIKEKTGVPYYATGTPDEYITQMREAGIDYAVIASFAPDNQLKNNNFWTVAITRAKKSKPASYPQLIPLISVSPTMKGRSMLQELETRLEWGMKGLKLHPNVQRFSPDDERMWPVYEWLVSHDLPVLAHTGVNIVRDETAYYGEPNRWLSVLNAFPKLKLVMAHLGHGYWHQTLEIAASFPNVMFDTAVAISSIDSQFTLDDAEAVKMIRQIGANRILFGSDYPWVDPKAEIERIRRLPISSDDVALILGGNAARLYKLTS